MNTTTMAVTTITMDTLNTTSTTKTRSCQKTDGQGYEAGSPGERQVAAIVAKSRDNTGDNKDVGCPSETP